MSDFSATKFGRCWSSLEFGKQPQRNQVVSETVHGAQLAAAAQSANCVTCVEGNKVCKCGKDTQVLNLQSEHHAKATSSFTHSVINMIGMLIGTLLFWHGSALLHGSSSMSLLMQDLVSCLLHMLWRMEGGARCSCWWGLELCVPTPHIS